MSPNVITSLPIERVLFGARGYGTAGRNRAIGTGEVVVYLLIAGVVIAAVCALLYLVNRMQHRKRYNSHSTLFAGLCRVHGLGRGDRALLKQVASQHQLAQPARVFTEPKWLDPAGLRGSLSRQASKVENLRKRLFGPNGR